MAEAAAARNAAGLLIGLLPVLLIGERWLLPGQRVNYTEKKVKNLVEQNTYFCDRPHYVLIRCRKKEC